MLLVLTIAALLILLSGWTDREGVVNNIESHVLALIQNEIFYPNEDLDKARDEYVNRV